MRRIIFCPNESNIAEAQILAKDNNLPVNIGLFDGIKNLDFDRTKSQVLEVPENNYIFYNKNAKKHFHQVVSYENDFISFNKDILLEVNKVEYRPILCEKHKARFLILENLSGIKNCNIIQNNNILESFSYNVD
jgi:hypothetical protein